MSRLRDAPTGSTAIYGVIGDPVAHSRSPTLHNAAFSALGVDAVSVALRVEPQFAAMAVALIRDLGVRGLSVTMPLKGAVVAHCEEQSDTVRRLGSANCLVRTALGTVRAESTDGTGLIAAVRCVAQLDVAGATCVVLGAGGAARAAIDALGEAGAAEIVVVARRPDAAAAAAAVSQTARVGVARDAAGATLIVQATPIGMAGTPAALDAPLLDPETLGAGQVAVDLVYHPSVTPWLARAASRGATIVPGLEILIHQAAAALELWLEDLDVPIDVLHDAVGQPWR